MLKKINNFSLEKKSWLLLSGFCLILELSALFVQYVLKFEPCLICVQQRALIMVLMLLSFVGMFLRKTKLSLLFIIGAMGIVGKIFDLALNKTLLQRNPGAISYCSIEKPFPEWFPLDKWIPELFLNKGSCSDLDINILGMSLSENLMIISSVMFIFLFVILVAKLIKK